MPQPPVIDQETNAESAGLRRDEGLFERFLVGDDAAFMELYDRHNPKLYLYCLKIVGNETVAEDLTQELWERMVRYRSKPQKVNNLRMFLLTIARNLCLNHLKSSRRTSSLDLEQESNHPSVSMREMSHLEELVVLSLPRLSFDQREVLILNVYCGYPYDQIAEMLGDSVTAVRMRASRARAHLGRLITAMVRMDEDREENSQRYENDCTGNDATGNDPDGNDRKGNDPTEEMP
jgi:RNA polymerase sigma-70 factor (ECF subfamily)